MTDPQSVAPKTRNDARIATPKLERKAVAAIVLGNALEFYDFTIYAFFAKPIGEAFFPAKDATDSLLASLALFGIGYVMRPIGGVVIGAYADRAGRKPAMLITIALMAVGMLMLALSPGYATLGVSAQVIVIAGRLIQGFALGGEVGPSTAYLLEAAPPAHRGFVASWQIASQGCAALVAGLVASALALTVGEQAMAQWGWRIMFGLGIAVVPVGLIIRSHLPETAGVEAGAAKEGSTRAVVVRLVRDHGRLLFLTFLVIAASTVSNLVGTNMPVYAETTLGLTATVSNAVPIALGLASIGFPLLGGWLADRIGRRPVMIVPRVLIAVLVVPAFAWLVSRPSAPADLRRHLPPVGLVLDQRRGRHRRHSGIAAAERAQRRPLDRLRVLGLAVRGQYELRRQQADRSDRRQARAGLLPCRVQRDRHDRDRPDAGNARQGSRRGLTRFRRCPARPFVRIRMLLCEEETIIVDLGFDQTAFKRNERHMIDASKVSEHMEVVGSDGQHVGTVDKLCIKLTKSDAAAHGQHHVINLDDIESADGGKLTLKVPASEAKQKTVQG